MIELFTDSFCDLNAEQIAERRLHVIPLFGHFNDQTYLDGVTITPPQLFKLVKQTGVLPKTSAPSMPTFAAQFAETDATV